MRRRNLTRKQKSSGQQKDPFRKALVLSGILHLGIILLFSISLPFLNKPPQKPERVKVTLVDAEKVTERARAPAAGEADTSQNKSEPDTKSKPDAKSRPDSPPKQIEPVKPPQAPKVDMSKPPEPEQVKQTDVQKQKPVPEPAPRKPAQPKPEQEPDKQRKTEEQDKQAEEKAEKQFQSVLKNLAESDPVREK
jgi:outer membrane biosynthesis protein TonB